MRWTADDGFEPGDEIAILVPTYMQTHGIATAFGARLTTRLAAGAYLLAALLVFALPAPGWIVGIAGLGYVANTLRFWNITDATCEDVNRAWRVFLWLNYLVGAIVTITLAAVFIGV